MCTGQYKNIFQRKKERKKEKQITEQFTKKTA